MIFQDLEVQEIHREDDPYKISYFCGAFLGDGHINTRINKYKKPSFHAAGFTVGNPSKKNFEFKTYAHFILELSRQLNFVDSKMYTYDNAIRIIFGYQEIIDKLISYEIITKDYKKNFTIPEYIRTDPSLFWLYLSGLIDTDGHVYKCGFSITSASKEYIKNGKGMNHTLHFGMVACEELKKYIKLAVPWKWEAFLKIVNKKRINLGRRSNGNLRERIKLI